VKGFVEAQGGTINVKNKTQGGAIFTIEIPTEISYLSNLKNE
jgi:two-component system, OmpR family, sensor histidine kinase KdpD